MTDMKWIYESAEDSMHTCVEMIDEQFAKSMGQPTMPTEDIKVALIDVKIALESLEKTFRKLAQASTTPPKKPWQIWKK